MAARRTAGSDGAPVDLRDPDEADVARRVAYAWRELRRGAATAALRDHFFGAGPGSLDPGQMDTLDVLVTKPEWRMSELADALRVEASTATRAVQRLVNDGLAERRPSGDDGRVVMVAPTAEGVRRHDDVSQRRGDALSTILGEFDRRERRDLADLMNRLVDAVDEFVAGLDDTTAAGDHR
ncbi:MAG: MarR family winged helix-turn-helix transcriptional regulator [Ilumatobacteraceae bacterium]|jgi:DNA-binding MarR family transcriptional regulator|nr:MarR family winged helix-turn-helix transcriptional regulator [Ilumatobacteraceae bacterium]